MADNSASNDMEAVARRISALNSKFDELQAANSGARTTARFMTILITIAALVGVARIGFLFKNAWDNKQQYVAEMKESFESRIKPALDKELQTVMNQSGPRIITLLQKRIETQAEVVFRAVDNEGRQLADNLQAFAQKQWADRATQIGEKIEKRLVAEIPEMAPESRDVVLGNAGTAMENATRRIINENLAKHMEHVFDLELYLKEFPVPAHIKEMNSEALGHHLTELLMIYTTNSLKNSLSPQMKDYIARVSAKSGEMAK